MSRLACLLPLVAAIGCAGDLTTHTPPTTTNDPDSASLAISEADIVHIDDGRLYAVSTSGRLSVVDISVSDRFVLLGWQQLKGRPFEMYLRGEELVAMTNLDTGRGAVVSVIDVRDPKHLAVVATSSVPGEIADSRFVGDILYLATYENTNCLGCGTVPSTRVTTFDVSIARRMAPVDQVSFESTAPSWAWSSIGKRSIVMNDARMYIGGHADIVSDEPGEDAEDEGIIDVLDVSDPRGFLVRGARLRVAGPILSRWQVDERDGILRVVSQQGAGRTGSGRGRPEIATFRIDGTDAFVPLGRASIPLPTQEGLRAVRFDGERAYAITYKQTDPLFTIDLSDPARPEVRGELKIPGFVFHLEPRGDRVIGLGIDRLDPLGTLNVSLFDVSDLSHPTLMDRVSFAGTTFNADSQILNGQLPEDQDRIQKAFRVFEDGLVAVPYSTWSACQYENNGVQLIDWTGDHLVEGALLPLPGNPRRAIEDAGRLLVLSDSHLRSFTREGALTAELSIGRCTEKLSNPPDVYYGCSGAGPSSGHFPLFSIVALLLFTRRRSRAAPVETPPTRRPATHDAKS